MRDQRKTLSKKGAAVKGLAEFLEIGQNRCRMGMPIEHFDYELPRELIAQVPAQPREGAKLMVLDRTSGHIQHRHIFDLPNLPSQIGANTSVPALFFLGCALGQF